MAYECQNFKNGQKLTAECMNKIDEWLAYICGKELTSAVINGNGELIFNFCNGETFNLGVVTGDQGEVGQRGEEGKSVYDLYVENGGTLSEAEWVALTIPDDALSDTSEKPVQNKVVKAAIDGLSGAKVNQKGWAANKVLGTDASGNVIVKDVKLSESDKADVVSSVIESLGGVPVFGVVNADNTITVTSTLQDGVYSIRYENADGSTTEIGTITVGDESTTSYTNLFNPSTAQLNKRYSSSSTAFKDANGYVVSDYIPIEMGKILRFRGAEMAGQANVTYFKSDKRVSAPSTGADPVTGLGVGITNMALTTDENGDYMYIIGTINGVEDSNWAENAAYIVITLQVNDTSTAITAVDIADIIVTLDESITD